MHKIAVRTWSDLDDRSPVHALVAGVDLVIVRADDEVKVFYGRCHHRGALLADGRVEGPNLICGLHGWDYRLDTGISEYHNDEALQNFSAWIEDDHVWVDQDEVASWAEAHPQPYKRDEYQGSYQDFTGTVDEPAVGYIRQLASDGLTRVGHHGPSEAMGVSRELLPKWEDLQFVVAQLHKLPLLDEEDVATRIVIGPGAKKPLHLDIPIFVSDMSFGALSEEAKIALAKGAEAAGTGICSGEGGMLPEEQAANSRYFYELASARFGFSWDKVQKTQAFHFKGGQGAKTGTGGHLPGNKVKGKIAEVRGLQEGEAAISPARFPEWTSVSQFKVLLGDECLTESFCEDIHRETEGNPFFVEEVVKTLVEEGVEVGAIEGHFGVGCDEIEEGVRLAAFQYCFGGLAGVEPEPFMQFLTVAALLGRLHEDGL